ncbi:hypothetical protein Halru_1755 [Halovivax ruber XH-70]|uniref:Protein-glutamine gamma-glutamyltransferase-like C-terminal domain-containing protein n=1 Tax=Halovivax ruber (strain DSM 18193 / JCM 13892 / XH-70) TaxID=797302 RepID=L0IC81_HALRX|nr:DUF4129 domain-containing protein [Halovivax ruber]AGB16354.1 hypothetical protein Halru_1755 [Halovivax ruber XH-70]
MRTDIPLRRLLAAVIAIVAIAAVAASIQFVPESAVTPGDSGGGGSPAAMEEPELDETDSSGPGLLFKAILFAGIVGLLIALIVFAFYDRRDLLRKLAKLSVIVVILSLFFYLVMKGFDGFSGGGMNRTAGEPQDALPGPPMDGGGDEGGQSSSSALIEASQLFGLVVGGIVLVAIGLFVKSRLATDDESTGGMAATAKAEVGNVAGDTADRIEDASADQVENAIYDAWYRMTTILDVENPNTSTPREFAAAAVDAGFDREDVEELTSLFEAVRYGPESPTAVTERRAVEILRRIEATYGEADEATTEIGSADGGDRQ